MSGGTWHDGDKPHPRFVRLLNTLADVSTALQMAGVEPAAQRRILMGLAEELIGPARPPIARVEPEWGWRDGVYTRLDAAGG